MYTLPIIEVEEILLEEYLLHTEVEEILLTA